jgi:hypothetical protein
LLVELNGKLDAIAKDNQDTQDALEALKTSDPEANTTLTLLFPIALSACSSDKLTVAPATVVIDKVPSALTLPCPRAASIPLPSKTVGGIITRSNRLASELDRCGAKVDGVAKWNKSHQASDSKS